MLKGLYIAALLAAQMASTCAVARVAPEPRDCIMSVGPAQMTFTAFQEQKTHETFCAHVPDAGPTVIILDAHELELRGMRVEIRILRNVGQHEWNEDLDANTELTLSAKNYLASNGTASFQVQLSPRRGLHRARQGNQRGRLQGICRRIFLLGRRNDGAFSGGGGDACGAGFYVLRRLGRQEQAS